MSDPGDHQRRPSTPKAQLVFDNHNSRTPPPPPQTEVDRIGILTMFQQPAASQFLAGLNQSLVATLQAPRPQPTSPIMTFGDASTSNINSSVGDGGYGTGVGGNLYILAPTNGGLATNNNITINTPILLEVAANSESAGFPSGAQVTFPSGIDHKNQSASVPSGKKSFARSRGRSKNRRTKATRPSASSRNQEPIIEDDSESEDGIVRGTSHTPFGGPLNVRNSNANAETALSSPTAYRGDGAGDSVEINFGFPSRRRGAGQTVQFGSGSSSHQLSAAAAHHNDGVGQAVQLTSDTSSGQQTQATVHNNAGVIQTPNLGAGNQNNQVAAAPQGPNGGVARVSQTAAASGYHLLPSYIRKDPAEHQRLLDWLKPQPKPTYYSIDASPDQIAGIGHRQDPPAAVAAAAATNSTTANVLPVPKPKEKKRRITDLSITMEDRGGLILAAQFEAFRFLELPAEIRNMVYRICVADSKQALLTYMPKADALRKGTLLDRRVNASVRNAAVQNSESRPTAESNRPYCGFTQVNQQVRSEFFPMYTATQNIALDLLQANHYMSEIYNLGQLTPAQRNQQVLPFKGCVLIAVPDEISRKEESVGGVDLLVVAERWVRADGMDLGFGRYWRANYFPAGDGEARDFYRILGRIVMDNGRCGPMNGNWRRILETGRLKSIKIHRKNNPTPRVWHAPIIGPSRLGSYIHVLFKKGAGEPWMTSEEEDAPVQWMVQHGFANMQHFWIKVGVASK